MPSSDDLLRHERYVSPAEAEVLTQIPVDEQLQLRDFPPRSGIVLCDLIAWQQTQIEKRDAPGARTPPSPSTSTGRLADIAAILRGSAPRPRAKAA